MGQDRGEWKSWLCLNSPSVSLFGKCRMETEKKKEKKKLIQSEG